MAADVRTHDDTAEEQDQAGLTRKQLLAGAGALGTGGLGALPALAAGRPRTREYWIAAVPTTWNIVPNGRDGITGTRYSTDKTVVKTVVYRQFTRGWRRRIGGGAGAGESITGPLIRARAGDTLKIHFKNMDTLYQRPHSMHFHGVHYRVGSDGAFIPRVSGPGANVKPGQSFTYELRAADDSVGVWPYHDHSPSMHESIQGGLYGAMSIAGRDERLPDREFLVFFAAMDDFMTINGRAFVGNTPVYHAQVGDRVQWDVLTLGDDFHTFHIHGHRWRAADGRNVDTQVLGPAESFKIGFREDVPGSWLYHCHVESHMMNGMIGLYHVLR